MSHPERSTLARKWESFSLVTLLLVASLAGILLVPAVSAVEPGDLSINSTVHPSQDQWLSSWDSILFASSVENQGLQHISNRGMRWYVCEGNIDAQDCKSDYDHRGNFNVPTIYSNSSKVINASAEWNPSGVEGIHTIVYSFDFADLDETDDSFSYLVNLTQSFVDLEVDALYDPTSNIVGLANYEGASVFNTNTDYTFKAKGKISACGTCNFVAQIGWQLWNSAQTVMLDESYSNFTNLPSWGGTSPFTRTMPAFSHSSQGDFFLKWGLFSSTGTPYNDLNPLNDVSGFSIVLNDALDIQVASLTPAHDQSSTDYFYGENMTSVTISNKGNVSVAAVSVAFEIFNSAQSLEQESVCVISNFMPGETEVCTFEITIVGSDKTLRITTPTSFEEGFDVKTGDNSLTEISDILAGSIDAIIIQGNPTNTYTTGEQILMSARTGTTAAGPLNYSWWVSGIINLGYGKNLNISGSVLGLGDHTITLRVTDTFGDLESVHTTVSLFNYVSLDNEPFFTGEATTQSLSYFKHESSLPVIGTKYSIGNGKQPLLLLSFEILSELDDSNITGLDSMNLKLNMSALLPSNIPLETVELRILPSLSDHVWTYLDEYTAHEDGTFDATLRENCVILIIGVSPRANITAENISKILHPGGVVELEWDSTGDLTNPYTGNWHIYKLTVVDGSGTIFPDPNIDFNLFIWEQLTLDTLVGQANLQDSSWIDPSPLNSSTCASYAIMAADREGTPYLDKISVSRDENGQNSVFCGDAIPPSSTVTSLQVSTSFTNSTDCFKLENNWDMCYDLNMTWVWPTNEPTGIVSWNLYRTEQQPSQIDLSFIQPIETGLTGTPGDTGYYNQSGEVDDMIRPYRTFYYILAPVDSVGNELFLANYPTNSVRVSINNEWWDYNQHLIPLPPEEPEPPLGVEWLGDLTDYMEEDEFKTTGMVTLIVLVTSLITLPLLMKKRKRLSRIMAARRKRAGANSANDDFEDFFD